MVHDNAAAKEMGLLGLWSEGFPMPVISVVQLYSIQYHPQHVRSMCQISWTDMGFDHYILPAFYLASFAFLVLIIAFSSAKSTRYVYSYAYRFLQS